MRRGVFLLCCALFAAVLPSGFCQEAAGNNEKDKPGATEPVPYEEEEFPLWLQDVRRFEVVLFGSVPFSFLYTTAMYALATQVFPNGNFQYVPSLIGETTIPAEGTPERTLYNNQQLGLILAGIGVSVVIAVVDQIIIHIKRTRAAAE